MEGVDSPTEGRNAPHHHEPSLMPLKPILKKPSAKKLDIGSVEITPHAPATSNENGGSSASGVTWDEPTIAEHDKERGTRTKISEPKTPYHADLSSDDESGHLNGSNSMDLDTSGTDGDHEDSHHHSTKLSPRFILPENKKKHHRPHHHHHTHESDGTTSSSGSSGIDVTEMRDEDQGRTVRKLRLQAEPLSPSIDVSVLQQRMAQVEQERATDDKRMQQDGKDDNESGSNSGDSDSDDDEEFLTPQERAKKAAFEQHRKQHYDEFRRMKELMQRGSDDADSSSSDESDD